MHKKWYTSDQHFFHHNIIKYCDRPFENVDQMNEVIIERHNKVVNKNDEVYILGDICFNYKKAIEMLEKLNGRKHFIIGNHDDKKLAKWIGWETSQIYKEIVDDKKKVILFHYPIASWHGIHRGAIHLHGHCHGNYSEESKQMFDIGVDVWDFTPVLLEQVLKYRDAQNLKEEL